MDLFEQATVNHAIFCPMMGTVQYHGCILSKEDADRFYESLLQKIDWQHDQALIYWQGNHHKAQGSLVWIGTFFPIPIQKVTKTALPLVRVSFLELKSDHRTGKRRKPIIPCLLNLYHDGSEGMAWHSDGEKGFKEKTA